EKFLQDYQQAFVRVFGQPAANQTWGFGQPAQSRATRSVSTPECPDIVAPYDEAWVATHNQTAKEPNSENIIDNYDNSVYHEGTPGSTTYKWNWDVMNAAGYDAWGPVFTSFNWSDYTNASEEIYNSLKADGKENWITVETTEGTEGYWEYDETFVRNFKITGTYEGTIAVVATEGLTDGVANGNERTVVVTGTWNITDDQRVGSLGKIIIANGGTVNVASGKFLNMVNEARLVVLEGGKLTGAGTVEVNNGNAVGLENYNAGTIDVATFNNNFGKFYNYGKFLVNEYQAGAVESNIYNHALVAIDHTNSVANARVFNACQFYVKNDARLRNYEGVAGSALIVGGQFMPFGSEDGTTIPSYVTLAAGALVKCGSLYNGSSWVGPTEGGYAALEIVNQIDYLNWVQDSPQTAGYFANNIYVKCGTWTNDPAGQGKHEDVDDGSEWGHINYTESRAEYKFWQVAANCTGNGNVKKVTGTSKQLLPADDEFQLGVKGCTPGFTGDEEKVVVTPFLRVIAEDLTVGEAGDFDFNDVVFDVEYVSATQAKVTVRAAGGTLPLYVDGKEVHGLFSSANSGAQTDQGDVINTATMINTNAKRINPQSPYSSAELTNLPMFTVNATWHDTQDEFAADVNKNIAVKVVKTDEEGHTYELTLTAEAGKTPGKVGVPSKTYQWKDEKVYVGDNFKKFVGDASYKWWE
ncbi:MAG: hypothetical protein IJ570_01530, partial [Prevotella sp.]|nr:hypothetical protein [Prevotella sp.]